MYTILLILGHILRLCSCFVAVRLGKSMQVLGHQPWTVRHWWRCTSHKARWWSNKTSPATPSTSCTRPGTNMPWASMAMAINGHQWPSMAMPCNEDGTGLTGSSLFQLRTLVPAPPRSWQCHSAHRAMWTSSKTAKWLPIWR